MDGLLSFLSNNYIWFLGAAVILILALIGFVVSSKKEKKAADAQMPAINEGNVEMAAPAMNNQEVPNMNMNMNPTTPEVQTMNVDSPSAETFAAPVQDAFAAPTMTFNDMPTPEMNAAPIETPVSDVQAVDPIQNNQFQSTPTLETPSFGAPVENVAMPSITPTEVQPLVMPEQQAVMPEAPVMPAETFTAEPVVTPEVPAAPEVVMPTEAPAPVVEQPTLEPLTPEPVVIPETPAMPAETFTAEPVVTPEVPAAPEVVMPTEAPAPVVEQPVVTPEPMVVPEVQPVQNVTDVNNGNM